MSDEYIRAGWLAQCGCSKVSALVWVSRELDCKCEFAEDEMHINIFVDLGNGYQWYPSGYAWDSDTSTLYKEIK